MDNQYTQTAIPALENEFSNYDSLSADAQTALQIMQYVSGDAFQGSSITTDLSNLDYASAAYELAFDTAFSTFAQSGLNNYIAYENRCLISASIMLGLDPITNGFNFIIGFVNTDSNNATLANFIQKVANNYASIGASYFGLSSNGNPAISFFNSLQAYVASQGYYVPQPNDIGGSNSNTWSNIAGKNLNGFSLTGQQLQNINSGLPGSSLSVGGLIYVPTADTPASSSFTPPAQTGSGQTFVLDPTAYNGTGAIYTVGASLDPDAGGLFVENTNGGYAEVFAQDSYEDVSYASGVLSTTITDQSSAVIGTLTSNISEDNNLQVSTGASATTVDVAGSGDLDITSANVAVNVASGASLDISGANTTITLGSNDSVTLGGNDVVEGAASANLTTDTLVFAGESIAGNFNSGATDQYGRTYTLNGSSLSISASSGTLTIDNFESGDFGLLVGNQPNLSGIDLILPIDINDLGQVVGTYQASNGEYFGFLESNGSYSTINFPGQANVTEATGINDAGEIVGWYGDDAQGFVESDGVYSTIGSALTVPTGINDAGEIVGQDTLDVNGVFTSLRPPFAPSGSSIVLTGIDNEGAISGVIYTSSSSEGFVYSDGSYTALSFAPEGISDLGPWYALGINGTSGDFAALPGPVTGINDSGEIVGWYQVSLGVDQLGDPLEGEFAYTAGYMDNNSGTGVLQVSELGNGTAASGTGAEEFIVNTTLASGVVIEGGSGTNTLIIDNGDISRATISNIQALQINGTATISAAQFAACSALLANISGSYNLIVTGALAANASSVAASAHVTSITVSDTAANVLANITTLEELESSGKVTSVTVSDTAADVLANIAALQALGSQLTSITLTDATTPTLALTATQLTTDSAVLGKISSAFSLTVSGVLAANAASVAGQAHVTTIAVSDTAADVLANIPALQAIGSQLASITLTNSTTPTLALTATQLTVDSAVLGKISSAYNITVSDTAADVLANITALEALESSGKVSSVTVSDTAANVLANISSLRSLENSGNITAITIADTTADVLADVNALKPYTSANGGPLTSITLTDGAMPTLTLTPAQLSNDSAVLQDITSYYDLTVSGGAVVLGNNQHVDITGSNDTVIPGLNDNFGVAGSNSSIMVDSEDGIFLTSPNGIADPLAALGANAVVGNGSGQTLSGGSGIDVMVGNGGNNTFIAPGAATGGTVTVWGGTPSAPSGSNTVDYSSYGGDLEIVLGQGEGPGGPTGWVANSDTNQYFASLNDIDNVIGGSGNNAITGNSDNDIINGGNGNDWLTGGSGNNTFIVGTGNNTINGGGGTDTYQFGSSFGQDVINNGYGAAAKGAIDFASGVTDENLWFQQSGSDLLVGLLGTNDQIDVTGWFNGIAGNQVQSVNAGGLKLDTGVASLVQAMATYAADNPNFNPATATSMPTDTTLQNAIAASWHH